MRVTLPKIAALVAALAYVAICLAGVVESMTTRQELAYLLVLLFPLALIWFPEAIGSATGFIGHGFVDHDTPPWLVSAAGWFLLIGLPLLLWLFA